MSFVGQVLHVFRQDVGRFWPALLGVGALMAVHWTVGLPVPSGYAPPFAGPIPVFPLIFMLFTVILIQDHRVAGDTDFWATRPLEALAILAGKAVFIGFFFCLVPVVVHVQWLLETAGGGDTRALLASSMLHQSGLLALVAAGAAATSGVGAFVALAVPVWLGTGALVGLLEPTFDFFPEQWMIKARAEILIPWVWLALGLLLLVHQFVTRRSWRTVLAGALGLAVLVPAAFRIPLDVVHDPLEPERRYAYPGADSIEIRLSSLSHDVQHRGDARSTAFLRARFSAERGPGVMLRVGRARSVFHVNGHAVEHGHDGHLDFSPGVLFNPRMPIDGIPPAGRRGKQPYRPNQASVFLARGSPEELEQLGGADRLDIDVTFDVYSRSVRAELPLEVGASTSLDAGTVEVDRVQREDGAVMVSLAYRLAVAYPSHPVELQLRHPAYAAILSRAYHGYVPFLSGGGGSRPRDRIPVRHFVGGASLHQEIVETAVSLEDAAGGGPPLPADWLDEAVLLLTESVYEGSFQRSFTLALDSLPASNRSLSIPPAAGSGGDG